MTNYPAPDTDDQRRYAAHDPADLAQATATPPAPGRPRPRGMAVGTVVLGEALLLVAAMFLVGQLTGAGPVAQAGVASGFIGLGVMFAILGLISGLVRRARRRSQR